LFVFVHACCGIIEIYRMIVAIGGFCLSSK
jgi:hypothetical protein